MDSIKEEPEDESEEEVKVSTIKDRSARKHARDTNMKDEIDKSPMKKGKENIKAEINKTSTAKKPAQTKKDEGGKDSRRLKIDHDD